GPRGVGGTRPPRLSPGGGNGKGGVQTSLLPQAVRAGVVRMPGTPLVYCVLAVLPRFSPLPSPNLYVDPLVPLSRSLAGATHSFAVLLSALFMGRTGPGASWGPISSPGPSLR